MPLLHRAVLKMPPVVPQPTPEDAIVNLNFIAIPGSVVFIAGLMAASLARLPIARTLRLFRNTLVQTLPSTLAITFMVGLAYVTRYSGMDTVLGLSLTGTGVLFPFFGTLLGWLGVALTGTDAGSNALFGNLQKVTAMQLGLSPILMGAANSTGGVMGKMIDAQSIVVASTATHQQGQEAAIFKAVFVHSITLACLVGLIVLGLRVPVPRAHSVTATCRRCMTKEIHMKTPTAGLMNVLRVAALAGCLQLAAVYPLAQAPAGGAQQPAAPAAQQPAAPAGAGARSRAWAAAGRLAGPDSDASFRRNERGHPVRAVRVVEGEEGQEGADDRDAARNRRHAHHDDAAEGDRPGRGRRLHPARADGIQPARLVRRAGAGGDAAARLRRRTARPRCSQRRHGDSSGAKRGSGTAAKCRCGTAAGPAWSASSGSVEQPERSAEPARAQREGNA